MATVFYAPEAEVGKSYIDNPCEPHRFYKGCIWHLRRDRHSLHPLWGVGSLAAGGWRLAAGGWRLAAGGWRLAAGGLPTACLPARDQPTACP
jgi:hypothetical protein